MRISCMMLYLFLWKVARMEDYYSSFNSYRIVVLIIGRTAGTHCTRSPIKARLDLTFAVVSPVFVGPSQFVTHVRDAASGNLCGNGVAFDDRSHVFIEGARMRVGLQ